MRRRERKHEKRLRSTDERVGASREHLARVACKKKAVNAFEKQTIESELRGTGRRNGMRMETERFTCGRSP